MNKGNSEQYSLYTIYFFLAYAMKKRWKKPGDLEKVTGWYVRNFQKILYILVLKYALLDNFWAF